MTAMQLVKHGAGLFPAYKTDAERIEKIKLGSLLLADVKQPRNPMFHRKFFALLHVGFERWEPEIFIADGMFSILKDQKMNPAKNFERFRKDVLITAGYRFPVVSLSGEVRWEAESISFASMDEERFRECYGAVFGVLWDMVLSQVDGMTHEEVDRLVDQMLSYE